MRPGRSGRAGKVGPLTHDVDLLDRLERWLTTPAMQAMGRRLLLGYLGLSLVGAVVLGVAYVVVGRRGVAALGAGQGSTIDFATFLISWLIMGGLLVVYQQPRLLGPHLLFVGAFIFVAYGYLNMLREPHEVRYGDFTAYFIAATQIQAGQPLETVIAPEGPYYPYLYPPLLATLLAPVSSIGIDRLVQLFDLLNYAAVLLFTLLLYVALRQYRFARQTAAIVAFLALIVNVAIMRTLIYRQINIVTADLILFSLTTYRSSKLLSAAALGVAVQLKVAPVLLVLVFVYLRDWAWVGWFVASQLLIVGATSLATSPNYYVQFVSQLMGLHETAVRNVAIDVVLYNTLNFLPDVLVTPLRAWQGPLSLGLRIVLLGFTLVVASRLANRSDLTPASFRQRVVLNGFAALPLAMLLAAPSIWEHHFVFVLLPMLVLLPALREPWQFGAWGIAYVFMFLQPVYDVFPVSYTRLSGLLLALVLFHSIATRAPEREQTQRADQPVSHSERP